MAAGSGPGKASKRGRSATGRAASSKERVASGRYTAPTPQSAKVSPPWWGPVFLILLVIGVLVILLNYLSVFGTPSGWALLIGLVIIAAGFAMATRYR